MDAKQSLFTAFEDGTLANKTLGEILKILSIPYREKNRLLDLLNSLVTAGKIYQNEGGRYGTIEQLGLLKGTLTGHERGFAFFTPEGKERFEEDLFIPRKSLHGALHKDSVLVEKVYYEGELEGKVVHILERGNKTVVGTFRKDRRAGYLLPDDKKLGTELYIPLSACHRIPNGVKAVAKITDYPYGKCPGAEIIEVLGDEEDFFAEELSIIRSYDLIEDFPPRVEREAVKQSNRKITEEEIARRLVLRNEPIVTFDGADTRDIDDAVSLKKVDGFYHLGVHIADVTHYVAYRSPLDLEAFERGTSVYFPDRVLPMLPRPLSNGICSLNEGADRLALSVLMKIDEKGVVREHEIVETVIRSSYKMTYDEVEKLLNDDKEMKEKYALVKDMVCLFGELTRILQENRAKKGSISLDVKEAKIILENDEIKIPDYKQAFSHQIIEAFMVLANETVAEYMHSIEAPFVYRVHEQPGVDKAIAFQSYAKMLGLKARFHADDVKPYDYQNLLKEAEGRPFYSVLNRVMLRSMQKARYSHENLGHFGLASRYYCHFTSPIRRYPDLCIHRIIKLIINGGYPEAIETFSSFVQEASKQSSERERRATNAERDVDDLYMTMYMSDHIGEEYEGIISGVTSFGLFAELPNTIEGYIPIESLFGEYTFDETRLRLVGKEDSYAIGERIRIRVVDVDFERRRTLFRLLEKL